jgi:hypothetical protein
MIQLFNSGETLGRMMTRNLTFLEVRVIFQAELVVRLLTLSSLLLSFKSLVAKKKKIMHFLTDKEEKLVVT